MSKIVSALGVLSAVLFAVAPQFSTLNPRTAAWLTLIGTAVAAASGAIVKFDGVANKLVTVLGVVLAVASVGAGAADLLPSSIVLVFSIVGTAAAALGKSLFGWEAEPTPEGPTTNAFKVIAGLLLVGSLAGGFTACAKKISGESAEDYKKRSVAIKVAQSYVGFDLAQDFLVILSDYEAISDAKQPAFFVRHDRALAAFDVLAQRLQSGLPVEFNDKQQLVSQIDAVIVDLDKIVKELGLLDENAGQKAAQIVSSIRLTLSSIKVIIAAQAATTPTAGELKAKYNEAIAAPKGAKPGWWDAAVAAIANQVSKMLFISAYTDPQQAWTEGFELSKAMHAENKNRAPDQIDK
jgi:hypothetical protein